MSGKRTEWHCYTPTNKFAQSPRVADRCSFSICPKHTWWHSQCTRAGVVEIDGMLWCKQHAQKVSRQ